MQTLVKPDIKGDDPNRLGRSNFGLCLQFMRLVRRKLEESLEAGGGIPNEIKSFVEVSLAYGKRAYAIVIPNNETAVRNFVRNSIGEELVRATPLEEPPMEVAEDESGKRRLFASDLKALVRSIIQKRLDLGEPLAAIKKNAKLTTTEAAVLDDYILVDASLEQASASTCLAVVTVSISSRNLLDKLNGVDPNKRKRKKFEDMDDATLREVVRKKDCKSRTELSQRNRILYLVARDRGIFDELYPIIDSSVKKYEDQIIKLYEANSKVLNAFIKGFDKLQQKFIRTVIQSGGPISIEDFARTNNLNQKKMKKFLAAFLKKSRVIIGRTQALRNLRKLAVGASAEAILLLTLDASEYIILRKRALSPIPPSLAEIGRELDLTRERIRQKEKKLIKKLRDSSGRSEASTEAPSDAIKSKLKNILSEHRNPDLRICRGLLIDGLGREGIPPKSRLGRLINETRKENPELLPTELQMDLWRAITTNPRSRVVLASPDLVAKAKSAYTGDKRLEEYGFTEIELAFWDVGGGEGGWGYSINKIKSMFRS